jgi:hypothetical protein
MSGNSGIFGEVAKGLVDQCVVNVVPGRNTGHTREKEIKGEKLKEFSSVQQVEGGTDQTLEVGCRATTT